MNTNRQWLRAPQFASLILSGLAITTALWLAQAVIVPITAAIILGMTMGPLVDRARKFGIYPVLTAFTVAICILAALAAAMVLLSEPVSQWIARIPETGARLTGRLGFLTRPLSAWRQIEEAMRGASGATASVAIATSPASLLTHALSLATPALGQFLVFVAAFFFFVAGRQTIRQRVTLSFISRENRLAVLHIVAEIERNLATWLSTTSLINAGLGAVMAVILLLLQVPNAVMWGVFIFMLNFVPYVGPLIMATLLAVVGFLTFEETWRALLPVAAYVSVESLEGHVLTPQVMGSRLHINPFVVFIAIVFWTWMWGPAGAILAMPLLITGRVVLAQLYPPETPPALPE